MWTKVLPGSIRYDHSAQQTNDGGFIVASHTGNILLTKTDDSGNIIWTKSYGGSNSEYGGCVHQTYDNGYIILGHSNSFGTNDYDLYIIKTNELGDTIWTRTFGENYNDYGHFIIQSVDSGYVAIGELSVYGIGPKSYYLVGLDNNGNKKFRVYYGGQSIDIGRSLVQTPDGAYILCGYTSSFGAGEDDIYVVKTGEIILNTGKYSDSFDNYCLSQNYPNPFNPTTKIKYQIPDLPAGRQGLSFATIKVYDVLGNEVTILVNEEKQPGNYEVEFNGSRLPSGVYFYRIQAGDFIQTKKMILLK